MHLAHFEIILVSNYRLIILRAAKPQAPEVPRIAINEYLPA